MKSRCFLFSLLAGLLVTAVGAADKSAPLGPAEKAFLAKYEVVRAALAADNLEKAKTASAALAGASSEKDVQAGAKKLSQAENLKDAREAFKVLSKRALAVAAGQPGYFHAHCPMVPGNQGHWVQTTEKISNPYYGKAMLTCGEIVADR